MFEPKSSSFSLLEENEREEVAIKYIYKIIMVGNSNVGKSSIASCYTIDFFNEQEGHTIGVSYLTKKIMVNVDNKIEPAKVCIWDTAGQERFFSIIKLYFKGIQGICCVYDQSNISTLRDCEKWLEQTLTHAQLNSDGTRPPIVLIGNKNDIIDPNNDTTYKLRETYVNEFIKKYNVHHIVCSARKNENINEIFDYLIKNMEYKKVNNVVKGESFQMRVRDDICVYCNIS